MSDVMEMDRPLTQGAEIGGTTAERLKSYIERAIRLEEEKQGIADDLKDLHAEARSLGFEVKAIKNVVKIIKSDKQDQYDEEHNHTVLYLSVAKGK